MEFASSLASNCFSSSLFKPIFPDLLYFLIESIGMESREVVDAYLALTDKIFHFLIKNKITLKLTETLLDLVDNLGYFGSCQTERRRSIYLAFHLFLISDNERMLKRTQILSSDSSDPIRLELAYHLNLKFHYSPRKDQFLTILTNYITRDKNYKVTLLTTELVFNFTGKLADLNRLRDLGMLALHKMLNSSYFDLNIKLEVLVSVLNMLDSNSLPDEGYSLFSESVSRLKDNEEASFFSDFVIVHFSRVAKLNEKHGNRQLTKLLFVKTIENIFEHKEEDTIKRLSAFVYNFLELDKEWLNSILFSKLFKFTAACVEGITDNSQVMLETAEKQGNDVFFTNFVEILPEIVLKLKEKKDWRKILKISSAVKLSKSLFREEKHVKVIFTLGYELILSRNFQLEKEGASILAKCLRWLKYDYQQQENQNVIDEIILKSSSFYKRRLAVYFFKTLVEEFSYSWLRSSGWLDRLLDLIDDTDFIASNTVTQLCKLIPFLQDEPIVDLRNKFKDKLRKLRSRVFLSVELSAALTQLDREMDKYKSKPAYFALATEEESKRQEEEGKFFMSEKARNRHKSFSTTNTKKKVLKVYF